MAVAGFYLNVKEEELKFEATQGGQNPERQMVFVSTNATGTISRSNNWIKTQERMYIDFKTRYIDTDRFVQYYFVYICVDISGLNAGTYNGSVTFTADPICSPIEGSPDTVKLTLVVYAPPPDAKKLFASQALDELYPTFKGSGFPPNATVHIHNKDTNVHVTGSADKEGNIELAIPGPEVNKYPDQSGNRLNVWYETKDAISREVELDIKGLLGLEDDHIFTGGKIGLHMLKKWIFKIDPIWVFDACLKRGGNNQLFDVAITIKEKYDGAMQQGIASPLRIVLPTGFVLHSQVFISSTGDLKLGGISGNAPSSNEIVIPIVSSGGNGVADTLFVDFLSAGIDVASNIPLGTYFLSLIDASGKVDLLPLDPVIDNGTSWSDLVSFFNPSISFTVTADGRSFFTNPHEALVIPKFALNGSTLATLKYIGSIPFSTSVPNGVERIAVARDYSPSGILFNQPVTITISYGDWEVYGLAEPSLKAFSLNPVSSRWEEIPGSRVDIVNNTVTFQTTHFSLFGIGGYPVTQLPKTGQTTSYASGDDGDIQAGVAWPSPRFTDNADGTVTDNLTGLMWTKDANLVGWGYWQNALNYIAGMNAGIYPNFGYTDWRLPNINEMRSLIDHGKYLPALPAGHPFTNIKGAYWTSTTCVQWYPRSAWFVQINSGYTGAYEKDISGAHAWPVRDGQDGTIQLPKTGQTKCYAGDYSGAEIPCAGTGQDGELQKGVTWPDPRFTDNGDGTVTDNLTGLMWLKNANCIGTQYPGFDNDSLPGDGGVRWQHGLDFVVGINNNTYPNCGASYTDWRLPSINELRSLINNYDLSGAGMITWLTTQGFSNVQDVFYWSSTTLAGYTDGAWLISARGGNASESKGMGYHVWPVRGGVFCGNGIVDPSEQCDDGNNISGDGCSAICELEVHVVIPNGGEVLPSGGTYAICCKAPSVAVKFDLVYSIDNATTWYPIASNVIGLNCINWKIPVVTKNEKRCLVKVIGYDASGVRVGEDTSDSKFTIEVVKVASPNGGEVLRSGSKHTITWRTHATIRPVAKVKLFYTNNGGATWNRIKTLTGNPGSYSWTVPNVTSTKCKVKVVLKDAGGITVGSDKSDKYFTIQP